MNKKTLALTLSGEMVTALTVSSMVHAQENPFGLQEISSAEVVAADDGKMKEADPSGKM